MTIRLGFAYSPYLEFERETVHQTIGQKAAYTSPLLQRKYMSGFLNPPIFYYLLKVKLKVWTLAIVPLT